MIEHKQTCTKTPCFPDPIGRFVQHILIFPGFDFLPGGSLPVEGWQSPVHGWQLTVAAFGTERRRHISTLNSAASIPNDTLPRSYLIRWPDFNADSRPIQ
jgi:hypothetical protein